MSEKNIIFSQQWQNAHLQVIIRWMHNNHYYMFLLSTIHQSSRLATKNEEY